MREMTVAQRIALPAAILTFYFVVPVGALHAPVGLLLGVLIGAAALAAVAGAVFGEFRGTATLLQPVRILVAFELVLVIFSLGYYILAINAPGQFTGLDTRLDALYFSMTTMSTVGYGDIHATGQLARGMVTLQLVFNLGFVAAIVALIQDRLRRGAVSPGDSSG